MPNQPFSGQEFARSIPKSINHTRRMSTGNSLARSFVYSSFKPGLTSPINSHLLQVHSSDSVHEDSADLADIAIPDLDNEDSLTNNNSPISYSPNNQMHNIIINNNNNNSINYQNENISIPHNSNLIDEETSLLQNSNSNIFNSYDDNSIFNSVNYDLEGLKDKNESFSLSDTLNFIFNSDKETLINCFIYKPVGYLPAVFLGTLLNVLDALSYGMIMFPIGEAVFSDMGPTGLSMFYVSTIISQLVYSLGGSAFKSGIGSEMIEVTPFFHQMAINIMFKLQNNNDLINSPDLNNKIITTTIFTFAISSIITGLCFLIFGKCKLGKLVGFFPRHILVGCIGGVGYFLIITGIEVSSRIEGGIEYNLPTLKYLLEPLRLLQWTIPLILAMILIIIQKFNSNPLIVPIYFIMIFLIFHLLIFLVPSWNLKIAREFQWIFQVSETNEPWYSFYNYYDFKLCDWWLVLEELPTMFALTFFGVLHVPINVPALALTINMDTFDVDRELIAHGVSNFLSGMFGSIQNYLVYTNSVLFIKSGADSRLSGVLLAISTTFIMLIGPKIIGFIPVCVVGSLIYLLGYELLKESIYDTIGRLKNFEYITILIIVITMGAWDFVYGILVGILLACVSFVIDAGSKNVITEIYTGEYARSIVVRHPKQSEFLKNVGKQICILKLSGSLFFGSIGGLEEEIRGMFKLNNFNVQPIKYLILDLNNVLTFDFSATEGFKRIRNLLIEKDCYFLLSSINNNNSSIIESLKFCGLWENEIHQERIQMFNNLNSALEWCENLFLKNYKDLIIQNNFNSKKIKKSIINTGSNGGSSNNYENAIIGTPRQIQFMKAARKLKQNEQNEEDLILNKINDKERKISITNSTNFKQPLYIILQIMQGLSYKTEINFWNKLIPYLNKINFQSGEKIYNKNENQPCLYFFESGLIDFEIKFNNLNFIINSSELPLTMFGDIIISNSDRSISYKANTNCILWKLDSNNINKLRIENAELYEELLVVCIRIATQRFESITSNVLIS